MPNFKTRILKTQIPRRAVQTQTHLKKQPSSTKQKISTAWTSGCFAARSLTGSDTAKLHELGIKSIVNLRHFSRGGDKRAFGDQFWLANKPLRSWEIKPAQIADVLHTIRERQKEGAVLVHCYHGADRTGLVAAKVANLNFSDVKIKFDDGIVCVSEARTENFQEALK